MSASNEPPPGTSLVMSAHRLRPGGLEITEQRRYVESTTRALVIAKWILAAQLELLLDRSIRAPVTLAPVLDLVTTTGRGWRGLVTLLASAMHESNHAFLRPIVTEPLRQALVPVSC